MAFGRRDSFNILLTFPPKITPLAKKLDCAVMGPTEEAHDPETPYRGAGYESLGGR
jgi:hypothetical protein